MWYKRQKKSRMNSQQCSVIMMKGLILPWILKAFCRAAFSMFFLNDLLLHTVPETCSFFGCFAVNHLFSFKRLVSNYSPTSSNIADVVKKKKKGKGRICAHPVCNNMLLHQFILFRLLQELQGCQKFLFTWCYFTK